jgi:hypothetical protein
VSPRLRTIIALFEDDMGAQWTHSEREYARRKWEALTDEQRKFLEELSADDLGNVLIGERRREKDVLYRGLWRPLPPGVDEFLEDIWNVVI